MSEVWFLTGSQALYGPETLEQVAVQSREIADKLDDALPVSVVWKPVLLDASSILRCMREANASDDCIGVVTWMHTFSPAKMWIAGLDALDVPLLHLHTQAGMSLPWSTIDMEFMNLNQAAHGDREFGHIESRVGVLRTTVAGHVDNPTVRTRAEQWARAALGRAELRSLRLARFGDNMRDVAVTEGDKVEAQLRFGVSVNTYGVNDLVDVVDGVSEAAVSELVDEYRSLYEIAPSLDKDGDRHNSLRYGARVEAGMRQFLTDGGFKAFTTNFEDLGGLRQLPGLAVQRLMADGYGFGGEGDWKTSMLLRGMKVMAEGLDGGTSFMEDYTYHLVPGEEKILGAHMLEVCPSITTSRPTLEIHPLSIGGREDPVRLRFTADPGHGVVVGLSDVGERFRLTANVIDVVEPDEALPKLPVACAVWEPQPSLSVSAESWLTAGAPHHTVLSTAIGLPVLEAFSDMIGVELLAIDSTTTTRGFQQTLRWNAAFHRLAARL
ncbi:L-arabinose isomerase [Rhodococcus sp. 06-412-2C]|uniref:L-arabinose isomerase n=1 Tax=unclassified Rhodococcus (in: high G+C Gram-positive bacteria) TaxID=192944 RepID=UPI000B9BE5D5|nr:MULTISPECIES: L-arabinose isomerase [unclassified Rhodococcus (in: high G+C Gram-positive bacteria)]OZC87049.1 L-arabinose isomerase [Rhodococcus sp. 06-412-2C]OZC99933.1 L-arabinose isomerase [Rhodococcus sp. 06-412-2B]